MPVWKGDQGTVKVVGSYAELKELSGVELDDYHRPWVDDITFTIDGEKFKSLTKTQRHFRTFRNLGKADQLSK